MQRKGMLIIVSGPSGVGKGTICAELRARNPQIRESISMTTRARRNGETEGVDYFYVSEERFNEMAAHGEMLEHAYVHGNQWPMWWSSWSRATMCCLKSTCRALYRP